MSVSRQHRVSWAEIFEPTYGKKLIFFVAADTIIAACSLFAAFWLRFDFAFPDHSYWSLFVRTLPLFIVVKVSSFSLWKMYRVSWRFVSIRDFFTILQAVGFSTAALSFILYVMDFPDFVGFPRSIVLLDALLTVLLVSTLRISKRVYLELIRGRHSGGKRTVILGAGNTGEMILRDMLRSGSGAYQPIAFLDDDSNRTGMYLHGIKVMGNLEELPNIVASYQASAVIIAIPSLGHARLRAIYRAAKELKVSEIKIVPRIYDVHRPELKVQELEDIKIEDLIGRAPVTIDVGPIGQLLEDKTVLVSGGAGSIGFELVRQLLNFQPRTIVVLDIDETALTRADRVLKRQFPEAHSRVQIVVGDIRDADRVNRIFARFRPEVVFHAAAYKHVPIMEENAGEAVKVNMFGTTNMARAAVTWGVARFVMISTDKAVRPTSIMGATKRMAENICRAYNGQGKTEFISVRFGNVLGSRGSVLPLFLEQIANGEPLTVTHKDMVRYFMTIPEAVSLVLEASWLGAPGQIMVLDMGRPVRIVELAEELLRLHGLEPYRDVPLQFVGLRPGEKLFEETLTSEEGTVATRHEKVFIANSQVPLTLEQVEQVLDRFAKAMPYIESDGRQVRELLKEYISWYTPSQTVESTKQSSRAVLVVQQPHVSVH